MTRRIKRWPHSATEALEMLQRDLADELGKYKHYPMPSYTQSSKVVIKKHSRQRLPDCEKGLCLRCGDGIIVPHGNNKLLDYVCFGCLSPVERLQKYA